MPVDPRACRVCGFLYDSPPWGDDGLTPSFEICPSCGVEFGYEDATPAAVRKYRAAWVAGGMKWHDRKGPAAGWDPAAQMANIPDEFR